MRTHTDEQPRWCKSSHSGDEGGNCLEIAAGRGVVRVRDSGDPSGPVLAFRRAAWDAWRRHAVGAGQGTQGPSR